MKLPLLLPTPELVRLAIGRFDEDERYGPADKVLGAAFARYPLNTSLEEVLLKVVLVNSLYNTNVYGYTEMARHIVRLGVDRDIAAGSPLVVDRISRPAIQGSSRRFYSFATKYCSWHKPEVFPIFDSLVEKLQRQYDKERRFATFSRAQLLDYSEYRQVQARFRSFFGLDDFTYKDIDKFLWAYAKGMVP